jgi:hypothetical protein
LLLVIVMPSTSTPPSFRGESAKSMMDKSAEGALRD